MNESFMPFLGNDPAFGIIIISGVQRPMSLVFLQAGVKQMRSLAIKEEKNYPTI
jgi:hypothetical protein